MEYGIKIFPLFWTKAFIQKLMQENITYLGIIVETVVEEFGIACGVDAIDRQTGKQN